MRLARMVSQTLGGKDGFGQSLRLHQENMVIEKPGWGTRLQHSGDASHFSVLTREKDRQATDDIIPCPCRVGSEAAYPDIISAWKFARILKARQGE